ncbi:helix-turn-helix domain-containing protein [Haladaptatus halobius]|uniref:helix-turn-helix domain-containing protein n=1 Tax=Haladaptatus halobius TaxID=2884875 RepID=UPI001D09FC2A
MRPGRPPKLNREEQFEVSQLLHDSPTYAGYDVEEWSVSLVQQLLDENFDVTYSRTSVHRPF